MDKDTASRTLQNAVKLPPIYCITLLDTAWRTREAKRQFDSLGLDVRWVYGFNGNMLMLIPGAYHDVKVGNSLDYMSPWHVGLCLSHIAAMGMAISDDVDECIIVENDVEISRDNLTMWPAIRKSFPDDIQVVQLEYCCHEDKQKEVINEHLSRCYYPQCSAANWWRRDALEFAMSALRPIHSPFDILLVLRVFPFVSHAITTPQFAFQKTAAGKWSKAPQ